MKAPLFAAAALSIAMLTPAFAGDRLNVPADQWLSPSALTDKLTSQGYKVHKIETDDGTYEVDMTDKNGVLIEADVHPATGEILPGYDD